MKNLLIFVLACFVFVPSGWAGESTVYLNTTSNFDASMNGTQTSTAQYTDPPTQLGDLEQTAFSTSGTYRYIFDFSVSTSDVPENATVDSVYLEFSYLSGAVVGGSIGARQIIRATGTASTDGLYRPNWRYYNTGTGAEWANYDPVSATNHLGSPDTSTELAAQTGIDTSENISLDVSSATGISATMTASGFKVQFLVYGKQAASYESSLFYQGRYNSYSGRPHLRILYTSGATPTPTPTASPTFTNTPTPGATNTPTPTPRIADELGARTTNEKVGIHGQLLIEEGLAAMDDGNTDPTDFREIIDKDGNFLGSLKNYVANPSFASATTGWVANASTTWAFNSDSFDDLDNSGSMQLTAAAANAEASKGIDYKVTHSTKMVFGAELKGTSGQTATLKIYSSSDTYSGAHTFTTDDWETAYLVADVTNGEDITEVSFLIGTAATSFLVDNVRFFHSDVLFPAVPDWVESGGSLSASTLTVSGVSGLSGAVTISDQLNLDYENLASFSGSGPHDVDTSNRTIIGLTTASGASGALRLNQGDAGQIVVLVCVTMAGTFTLTDNASNSDSGNIRLSANWTPGNDDTLSLFSDGTDWIEFGRVNN